MLKDERYAISLKLWLTNKALCLCETALRTFYFISIAR